MSGRATPGVWGLLVLLTACGPRESQVNGDVFVVTRGSENVKLGLVQVSLVPEAAMTAFVAQKSGSADEAVKKLNEELFTRSAFVRSEEILRKWYVDGLQSVARLRDAQLAAGHDRKAVNDRYENERSDYERKIAELDEQAATRARLAARIKWHKKGCAFTEGLPPAAAVAKTDADGKFIARVKPDKYVAIAAALRHVGNEVEDYCWLVRLDTTNQREKRIMLSNDNLAETTCLDCMLSAKHLGR